MKMSEVSMTFRLTDNLDPEERLEEACIWKALHDEVGDKIKASTGSEPTTFGRLLNHEFREPLTYWLDPAFLKHVQRHFVTLDVHKAIKEVERLHSVGKRAFVKSTRDKHAIFDCPVGVSLTDAMESMIYSFIDGGPLLMVQEHIPMEYEWRFFCIERRIVADSVNHPSLTPLDYPSKKAYKSPKGSSFSTQTKDIRGPLYRVAINIARDMENPNGVIDCAYIDNIPGCVEINPYRLGHVGLFACDVRTLCSATLSHHLRKVIKVNDLPFYPK